eukprot:2700667-Pleurochrysis_carterae.AAC.3
MHSLRSSITLRILQITPRHYARNAHRKTQGILHQNRSVNFYCSRQLGSRQSRHTCRDRMERANGNGAKWQRC